MICLLDKNNYIYNDLCNITACNIEHNSVYNLKSCKITVHISDATAWRHRLPLLYPAEGEKNTTPDMIINSTLCRLLKVLVSTNAPPPC